MRSEPTRVVIIPGPNHEQCMQKVFALLHKKVVESMNQQKKKPSA